MDLDQQVRLLIDNAPQDGQTPGIIKAIAPALEQIAVQLRHSQYYILQTLNQRWVVTTLSNRAQPDIEKKVIYAFPSLEDAKNSAYAPKASQAIALPVPVIHILFQMVTIDTVDSVVFFETPGELTSGTEVPRQDIQHPIRLQLQKYLQHSPKRPKSSQLPPDIA
ncbi:hypothetical protein [Phormidium sp. CCY1219]|uniref:hypothetical protein n=1 Tax=Phormidium sp. CCY1219 TaxID=2886104 RepID=UPI002D1E9E65|nr:hypothetical protein [Phormidium sp. CCY1219]MEB3831214.1 hypothetical protein [Phormidium sp. CCY1219]